MFDDLAALFCDNVLSAYEAYTAAREHDTSGRSRHLRAGIELATALYHFREHLPAEYKKTRNQTVAECADYRLVADVVNAAKHRVLTRSTSEGTPLVKSAEDLEEVTIVTRYSDDAGEYSDARTALFANCSDGVRRNLDVALANVLNYWGNEVEKICVVKFSPRPMPTLPGTHFVVRANARLANFEIVRGIRWKQTLQLLQFNVENGFAEPIDLTGSKITMPIYQPIESIDITLSSPDGMESIDCTLELSEEQSFTLFRVRSEAEREQFIASLVRERQEEISQMVAEALSTRDAADPNATP